MYTNGTNFFTLKSSNKNISDALLISELGSSISNTYEAYGFSENQLFLKKYTFLSNKNHDEFLGFIKEDQQNKQLIADEDYDDETHKKIYIPVSNTPGVIQLKLTP